jgi:DNA-binding beta-propeller fold protein YncE
MLRSVDLSRATTRIRSVDRRRFLATVAAGSVALAFEPRRFGVLAGGIVPRALVTADLESQLVVLDLESARVVERVRTAPGPRSIERVGGATAVVGHTGLGVVSILDAAGRVRLRAELDAFDEPRYTAVHHRSLLAYVTDSGREAVVVVDPQNRRVLWRTRVPGPARHISVSRDGRTLWTALGTKAERIAVLDISDPRRPRFVRTVAPPFLAHDVVFSPDGRTVWVTSGDERSIALYRAERRPVRVLAAGSPPQHVTFGKHKAFVASGDDGSVRRHRLDGTFVREARVPLGSYNISFGLHRVVTPSLGEGTVTFLDPNGRVAAERKVARAAHDACVVYAA